MDLDAPGVTRPAHACANRTIQSSSSDGSNLPIAIFNCSSSFFFQAEDGIRYLIVTGVQTCALPISVDFTGDRGFVEAFRSGADLHRTTAAQVFNVKVEDVTKEQRDFAKRLNFGVVYGDRKSVV